MSVSVSIAEFKIFFARDFTFSSTLPDISDTDIQKGIDEANQIFNFGLYGADNVTKQALYYLIAHFVKLNVDSADSGAQAVFIQNSRSVGSVSESITIPDWMNSGEFSFYATTYYGQKYLTLSKPYLDGAVFSAAGGTQF